MAGLDFHSLLPENATCLAVSFGERIIAMQEYSLGGFDYYIFDRCADGSLVEYDGGVYDDEEIDIISCFLEIVNEYIADIPAEIEILDFDTVVY